MIFMILILYRCIHTNGHVLIMIILYMCILILCVYNILIQHGRSYTTDNNDDTNDNRNNNSNSTNTSSSYT